jgi:hypothetical protein
VEINKLRLAEIRWSDLYPEPTAIVTTVGESHTTQVYHEDGGLEAIEFTQSSNSNSKTAVHWLD